MNLSCSAMTFSILSGFQNLWHFILGTHNDLKISDTLVRGLSVSEDVKQFILAIRDPHSQSVIYILAAQNLSEQSALDAEHLIKEVQPHAVIVQVPPPALLRIKNGHDLPTYFPTSCFEVLKGCFIKKINKDQYEDLAGHHILQAIFGVGFCEHFFSAKTAAEAIGSHFHVIESSVSGSCEKGAKGNSSYAASSSLLQTDYLVQVPITSAASSSVRLHLADDFQLQMARSLTSVLSLPMPKSSSITSAHCPECAQVDCLPRCNYQAPSFAKSVYSLLVDLHSMFMDVPAIGRALYFSQKILLDIYNGNPIDIQHLSEVNSFRLAVEGLRIALSNSARSIANSPQPKKIEFHELPAEEKSCVLLAQALKGQTKRFQTVVAVVDASLLGGIRKNWHASLPQEVIALAEQCVKCEGDGDTNTINKGNKMSLSEKPVVAVGAGATAVLGASSLSKALPASTFLKVISYKAPASIKFGLLQTQRSFMTTFAKFFSPKFLVPGFTSSKASAAAVNIRAVAHSVVASAERTSFQAMRTAFYEIMRRQGRPRGITPWTVFFCSMATCTGLLVHGDGIECAAESAPAASKIAAIGRGLHGLKEASRAARLRDSGRLREMTVFLTRRLNQNGQ